MSHCENCAGHDTCYECMSKKLKLVEQEAERLRHGNWVEGDMVCPNQYEAMQLREILYDFVFACAERNLVTCYVVTDYDGHTPEDPGHRSIFGSAPANECKMCKARMIYNLEQDKDKCPPLDIIETIYEPS